MKYVVLRNMDFVLIWWKNPNIIAFKLSYKRTKENKNNNTSTGKRCIDFFFLIFLVTFSRNICFLGHGCLRRLFKKYFSIRTLLVKSLWQLIFFYNGDEVIKAPLSGPMSQWKLTKVAKNWQNWPKLHKIVQNCTEMPENGAKLRKIAGSCGKLSEMGTKLPEVAENCQKWAQNCRKWRKVAQANAKLPKLACQLCIMLRNLCQFCQFLATFVNFHCDMGPFLSSERVGGSREPCPAAEGQVPAQLPGWSCQ